ncbi:hypothetical protein OJF2_64760 [Aquisphaera giovannonii]|uniref:Uncharacterized protein n=1 Tax=Aquisphaera giovannonii TaxID=406548 RepID=A0A5B9WC89_9BACT|nr:hypothetical protein [Aquisphaera giovannonii]QEH37884.1 hypothetical protein OJF2_64760 [Aquisphaera giovannonii]
MIINAAVGVPAFSPGEPFEAHLASSRIREQSPHRGRCVLDRRERPDRRISLVRIAPEWTYARARISIECGG